MYVLGLWLNEDELFRLNQAAYRRVIEVLESDREFVSDPSSSSKLSGEDKSQLMADLLLLCFMNLGGQRREFIMGMTKEVSLGHTISQ